jgi:hypothetical protein
MLTSPGSSSSDGGGVEAAGVEEDLSAPGDIRTIAVPSAEAAGSEGGSVLTVAGFGVGLTVATFWADDSTNFRGAIRYQRPTAANPRTATRIMTA